jgi:hypothetical protein
VIVRPTADSVAGAKDKGVCRGQAKKQVDDQQHCFLARLPRVDPSARSLAKAQIVLNAVFVEVDAAALPTLAKDPMVPRIAPVKGYELDLAETMPNIGATTPPARASPCSTAASTTCTRR